MLLLTEVAEFNLKSKNCKYSFLRKDEYRLSVYFLIPCTLISARIFINWQRFSDVTTCSRITSLVNTLPAPVTSTIITKLKKVGNNCCN